MGKTYNESTWEYKDFLRTSGKNKVNGVPVRRMGSKDYYMTNRNNGKYKVKILTKKSDFLVGVKDSQQMSNYYEDKRDMKEDIAKYGNKWNKPVPLDKKTGDNKVTNTNVTGYKIVKGMFRSIDPEGGRETKQVLAPSGKNRKNLIDPKTWKALNFNLNRNVGSTSGSVSQNLMQYFDRFYSIDLQREIDQFCQYVFIVRPDLNILSDDTNHLIKLNPERIGWKQNNSPDRDQLFRFMKKNHPYLLSNLTGNWLTGHDFMPYMVGRTESLNLPDYTIKDYNMNQPFTNYNLPYASHALASQTGGQFTITFREDRSLRMHKLFQTWVYYIDGVTRNKFSPKKEYIRDHRIDYACSVYSIICRADASEIVYWTKYTGCFPTSVPNSDLSFNLRGAPKTTIDIPFDYFYAESLNPYILVDFNKNAHIEANKDSRKVPYVPVLKREKVKDIGLKDTRKDEMKQIHETMKSLGAFSDYRKNSPVVSGTGNRLVGCPFIVRIDKKFYLRWKKIKNQSPTAKK